MNAEAKIIYPDLSYKVVGACFAVHNELGRYCNEKQYADCFEGYLKRFGIIYEREKVLPRGFESEEPGRNKADFLIENKIVLELKAKRMLNREDYYQVRRYLQAMNKKLGILVNFRDKYLHPRRILNSSTEE